MSYAEERVKAGLVDEADFDDENLGRAPADILDELQRLLHYLTLSASRMEMRVYQTFYRTMQS